jgi:tight adherence protein C
MGDLLLIAAVLAAVGTVFLLTREWANRLVPRFEEELAKETDKSPLRAAQSAAVRLTARRLVGRLRPATNDRLAEQIIQLGSPQGITPEVIVAGRVTTAASFGFAFAAIPLITGAFLQLPLALVAGGSVGWLVATLWFRNQVKDRANTIMRTLPYELDLLTLAVEAGLDFVGGLQKVVEQGRSGPLKDELVMVLRAIRLGRTRAEALQEMSDRLDLAPVRSWVRALVQADRMGTPLGKILRMQSERLRERRGQTAEQRAQEAPVKMLFPLIFFIFPTVFLVLFGPIVFRILFVGL